MVNAKCKICRRLGRKLFLKGEKCSLPKCPMVKKPYPPGIQGKRRKRTLSEYGKELKEKQKLKNLYGLSEAQFKKYVQEALEKRKKIENTADFLIQKLEFRLDNIVFRLGLANSHSQARQLISHGHFLVNNRPNNIPSYQVKLGDKIAFKPSSKQKAIFQNLSFLLKKHEPPSWVEIDKKNLIGKVIKKPSVEEVNPPAEISVIFEYYSR